MTFDYRAALTQLASDLLESGNVKEALFHLQRLVENYPDSSEAYQRLGEGLLRGGLLAAAQKAFELALTLDSQNSTASLRLADLHWQAGRRSEALDLLRRAARSDPPQVDVLFMLGQMLMATGDAPGGLAQLQKAIAVKPDAQPVLFLLARALHSAGRPAEAKQHLLHLVELAPTLAAAHNLLSVIYWQKGQPEPAWTHIVQAVQHGAQDPDIAINYAVMASARKGRAIGQGLLEQYLARYPNPRVQTELDNLKRESPAAAHPRPTGAVQPRQVVFVGNWPRMRQAKMAFGLRAAGWRTVLLYQDAFGLDVSAYFDEAVRYKDEWEALALANTYSPRVYHAFSSWSESASVALIRHKPGKVVYDCYDIVAGIRTAEHEVEAQRYCLENADGLCCRDLRPRHLVHELGYRLPAQRIFFPDYCWDEPEPVQRTPRDEIHAAMCGAFSVEKLGEEDAEYLKIAKAFAAQRIHLHIYPSPMQLLAGSFETIFSDYIDLEQQTPYFHLHRPVSIEQLIPELRQYDIGLFVLSYLIYGGALQRYAPWVVRDCISARVFDYLDAGLPTLTHKELAITFSFLSRYGAALDANVELITHLADGLRAFLTPQRQARLRQARAAYSVRRQIGRLTALYERL